MPHTTPLACHLERHLRGPALDAFSRDDVTDIHCNVDGVVRLKTHRGAETTGSTLEPAAIRSVLNLLADSQGDSLRPGTGFFAGRFPGDAPFRGARIHAALPPVTARPIFSIRVHAPEIFTLADFIASPEQQRLILEQVLLRQLNVLIIGGTSTGKTSLLNSLLQIVSKHFASDRVICLEDVAEITVSSDDHLCLRTEATGYTLQDLVANALRLNPARLVVGEVRGGEALDLIDAWSTGHRGGFATLHADDVNGALLRLERLARRHPRAGTASLRPDVAAAVDVVIELRRAVTTPQIHAVHRLAGSLCDSGRYLIKPITTQGEH